jgi:hypothetical protein
MSSSPVDHELEDRAECAARSRLAQVETDDVTNAVVAALLALDQEDLAANAGRTRYGYVEPTEAAWSLLEAAVEPWLEDITLAGEPGITEAARRLGLGTLRALQSVERHIRNDDLLVSWAPDFPDETADRVVELLSDVGIALTDAERATHPTRHDAPAEIRFADAEGSCSPVLATKTHHQQ